MSKSLRTIGIVVGAILALVLIGWVAWMGVERRSFPKTSGTLHLAGLDAPVDVYRDQYGIPHIYATTSHDLFFAEGYVHAQDRYWQMEFWRRIGAGRLSEFFGSTTLGTDEYLRTMGFARIAEQEYADADPATRAVLDSYAEGVNAYTQTRKPAQLDIAFALLQLQGVDVTIEPWTPVNTLTWAHVMSQDLGGNYDAELARIDLIRTVGYDKMLDLYPPFRSDFPYIIPDDELKAMGLMAQAPDPSSLAYLQDVPTTLVGGFDPSQGLALGKGQGIGSNNWVISGALTATGMPILANDPHLGIQMPSIWYEVDLHCMPKSDACPYEVRGYSFAGAPGVIIGHNDRIAWGMTNVNPDVQDLYVERLNPANINQYEVNGQWTDMTIVPEVIKVQGQDDPTTLLVRQTRHGPIITDLKSYSKYSQVTTGGDTPQINALALRWTALDENRTFESILLLDRAQNWDDFRAALQYFDSPSQNFIYADVDGNIGYQMPGLVPIRAKGDGSLPVPGWTDDYEWTGFIPYDQLPRTYNPAKGYVVTANQPVVSPNYPYLILYQPDFDAGYRADRITQMITGNSGKITLDDVAAIQGDDMNLLAPELDGYLKSLTFSDPAVAAARDALVGWDGEMRMDSPQAALYGYFWVDLIHATFGDDMPADLLPGSGGATMTVFHNLLSDPSNAWWDDVTTSQTETRDDILTAAFEKGYRDTVNALGSDMSKWRWGDVHTALFANQTFGESGIGPIEAIFNRGPVAVNGGASIVNATSWNLDNPFVVTSLPSMRQIIDLSNLANSRMIHTTGQSGHPGSPHYADFIDLWRTIQYHPTYWNQADAISHSRQHLVLSP